MSKNRFMSSSNPFVGEKAFTKSAQQDLGITKGSSSDGYMTIQGAVNKSLILTVEDEKILLEKSIFLGGNKILDNTCITVSGILVNRDKTIKWRIRKNI